MLILGDQIIYDYDILVLLQIEIMSMFQAALDIRIAVFGGNNLHVALAYEDLAYSSYVHEYSTGKFTDAK